jgi:hypothetical protein
VGHTALLLVLVLALVLFLVSVIALVLNLPLAPKSRVCGAIPHFPPVPSWHVCDNFNFIIIIIRIFHFSALGGKYSPILGYFINRIRLGGLMYNLGNFLQSNMCQELPLFAFVYEYMCLGAG